MAIRLHETVRSWASCSDERPDRRPGFPPAPPSRVPDFGRRGRRRFPKGPGRGGPSRRGMLVRGGLRRSTGGGGDAGRIHVADDVARRRSSASFTGSRDGGDPARRCGPIGRSSPRGRDHARHRSHRESGGRPGAGEANRPHPTRSGRRGSRRPSTGPLPPDPTMHSSGGSRGRTGYPSGFVDDGIGSRTSASSGERSYRSVSMIECSPRQLHRGPAEPVESEPVGNI